MHIKGLLATTHPDANGRQFSEDAIEQIHQQVVGVKIGYNFEHNGMELGEVTASNKMEDGSLIIEWTTNKEHDELIKHMIKSQGFYVVPGYTLKHPESKEFVNLEVSITPRPVDPTLKPIEEIQNG